VVDSGYGHEHFKYMKKDGKRKESIIYRVIKKFLIRKENEINVSGY